MSSLKRRLDEDEAAIASLSNEVKNLKRFKVGDRTITMREVPVARPFPFVAPPASVAPRVNVNVQTPKQSYADVREGERQAFLSGYKMSFPRYNSNPSIAVAPMTGYKRRLYTTKKGKKLTSAQMKSKASLKKAKTSIKKGGSRPSKATLIKAGKIADFTISYRNWMKQTKARLLQALKTRKKSVLAACLAKS